MREIVLSMPDHEYFNMYINHRKIYSKSTFEDILNTNNEIQFETFVEIIPTYRYWSGGDIIVRFTPDSIISIMLNEMRFKTISRNKTEWITYGKFCFNVSNAYGLVRNGFSLIKELTRIGSLLKIAIRDQDAFLDIGNIYFTCNENYDPYEGNMFYVNGAWDNSLIETLQHMENEVVEYEIERSFCELYEKDLRNKQIKDFKRLFI